MRNKLAKVMLSTMLVGSALVAGTSEYEIDTYSLVGVEAGFSSFDYERDDGSNVQRTTGELMHGGIKIGAQSKNYRVFLSARYYDLTDFDYARTYGVEGQYMFNFSEIANLYIGVNAGTTDMKLIDVNNNSTVKVYEPYYGGDVGANIHFGDSIDWEIGVKYMTINSTIDKNSIKYNFDRIITAYTSLIYKFKMD
jgi:hypothetical protein